MAYVTGGKEQGDERQSGAGVTIGRSGTIKSQSAPSAPSPAPAGNNPSGQSQSPDRDTCGWNG